MPEVSVKEPLSVGRYSWPSEKERGVRIKLALILAVMLVLAACGEQDSDAPAAEGEETLADFLGWGFGLWSTPEDDPEAAREDFTRIQEAIQQCMADRGFDYQPVVPPDSAFTPWVDELSEEERVRTFGFGITTWYGREDPLDILEAEWVDPNQAMVEGSSDSDQEAWFEALFGMNGCEDQGYGWTAARQIEELFMQELGDALDAMWQQIDADPRMVEAEQEWTACMSEAGYEFAGRGDLDNVLEEFEMRLWELEGELFEEWEIDLLGELTDEEAEALLVEAEERRLPDIDQDALEALQQEEIDLALADLACRGDYFEIREAVSREYEAAFIAEHRAALERIRDTRLERRQSRRPSPRHELEPAGG